MKRKNSFYSLCLAVMSIVMGSISIDVYGAGSLLRVTCYDDDVGAEVLLNGKSKGKCPVDIMVPEGSYKLRAVKTVDDTHERVFEQEVLMGEGTITRVEAVLSAPRLTAVGQRREEQRLAVERAETMKREEERQRVEAMERAEAAKREAEGLRIAAQRRVEFNAALASGAIQEIFRDCPDCPEMVAIPPGSFEMGSDDYNSEKPVHRVNISRSFALGKTEVTQGQWKAIMGNNPSKFSSCGDNCPVEQVSWDDIQTFLQKLNAKTGKQYRLPSESEWEYAARAGSTTAYPWGDQASHEYANYGKDECCAGLAQGRDQWVNTSPAGSFPANAFGLYDMIGNVYEWTEDSYHDNYNGAPGDGSAWGGDGAKRVLRGGSWYITPQDARAANRYWDEPAIRDGSIVGFRLARTLP